MAFTFDDMKEKLKCGINYGNALECFDDILGPRKIDIENEVTYPDGVYHQIKINCYDYRKITDADELPELHSYYCPEALWGNPKTTTDIIDFYKDLGFTAIRLPVNLAWYHAPGSRETYSGYLKYIKSVVKMITDAGLFCVVTMFCEGYNTRLIKNPLSLYQGGAKNPNIQLIVSHWTELSSTLSDIPVENLAYDLLNEFSIGARYGTDIAEASNIIAEIYRLCISAIRSNGGFEADRLIGIGGFRSDAEHTFNNIKCFEDILTDDKVFLSLAMYLDPGYTFCYKEIFSRPNGTMIVTDSDTTKAQEYINGYIGLKKLGYNIIVSEYGATNVIECESVLDTESARAYANNLFKLVAIERIWQHKLGAPGFYWDNGSLFDRLNLKVKIPYVMSLIKINTAEYTELYDVYKDYIVNIEGDE